MPIVSREERRQAELQKISQGSPKLRQWAAEAGFTYRVHGGRLSYEKSLLLTYSAESIQIVLGDDKWEGALVKGQIPRHHPDTRAFLTLLADVYSVESIAKFEGRACAEYSLIRGQWKRTSLRLSLTGAA